MFNTILKLSAFFEKIANEAYEEYKERVEQLSKQNPYPFSAWFNENGRAYIEFRDQSMDEINPGDDKWVIKMLEDAGWQVIDYKGGYAQKGNRKMRIAKIINQIRREEEQKWQLAINEAKQRDADEFEMGRLEEQYKSALQFIDENLEQFINSEVRAGAKSNGLMIVISQNPHDVATMSTGRSWESCMTLGTGGYHQNVYCEVENGGLIAYLIDADDKDIQRPHARIHIRRFDNRDGNSIAVPERSVYGQNVPGFQEAVQNWLNTMQQQMPPGIYERQGGSYSDTFSSTYVVTPQINIETPEGQSELVSWINGQNLPKHAVYNEYHVEDNLFEEMGFDEDDDEYRGHGPKNRSAIFLSREEAQEYIQEQENLEETDSEREVYGGGNGWSGDDEYGWNESDDENGNYSKPRFTIREEKVDNTKELQARAAQKLLDAPKGTLTKEALIALKKYTLENRYGDSLSPFGNEVLKKYPELFQGETQREFSANDSIKFIESLPEDQRGPYLEEWKNIINDSLKTPTNIVTEETKELLNQFNSGELKDSVGIIPSFTHRDQVEGKVNNAFQDNIIKPLRLFKQIPEETIQELIQFSNSLPAFGLNNEGTAAQRINDSILFEFGLKRSDTPAVQDYIRNQLWRYDNKVRGESNKYLLYAIAGLEENGKSFLPFLNEKLEESKQQYYTLKNKEKDYKEKMQFEYLKKHIESLLFVIDTINNGERSKKYKFHH